MRTPTVIGAMAMSLVLVACQDKTNSTTTNGSSSLAAADAGPTSYLPTAVPAQALPAASLRPDLREARLVSLTKRPSSMVDVARGRPADADHPAGTVFVAAVLDGDHHRGEATLFEWDVASASLVEPAGKLIYRESDKEENGRSLDVRIASSHGEVFAAVTLERGRFTVVGAAEHVLRRDYLPRATNLSLETNGRYLVVAYERTDHAPPGSDPPATGVLVYDASSMHRLATLPFSQAREVGVRYDILEMLGDRLFAAEVEATKLRVVELELPSGKTLRTAEISVPKGNARVELTELRGHLVALTHDTLVELTPELELVGKRELRSDEVALGPGGEPLTPLGREAPGKRGDFVPDARASASCTPWWAGDYPLLACAVDLDGVRIVRLAPR